MLHFGPLSGIWRRRQFQVANLAVSSGVRKWYSSGRTCADRDSDERLDTADGFEGPTGRRGRRRSEPKSIFRKFSKTQS